MLTLTRALTCTANDYGDENNAISAHVWACQYDSRVCTSLSLCFCGNDLVDMFVNTLRPVILRRINRPMPQF